MRTRKRPVASGAIFENVSSSASKNKPSRLGVQASARLGDQRERRFRHDVEALHRLGPRVLYEALAELGARRFCRTEIEELAARYAEADPETIRVLGADRWPAWPPLRVVS
jgi:hypothetical protein